MKKIISLLIVALSVVSTTAIADISSGQGKHIDLPDKTSLYGQYSGTYLLRKGMRISLKPVQKNVPKAYWSGNYVQRRGIRTTINPEKKSIHKSYYSGKYYFRKGERFLVNKKKHNS